MAETGRCEWCGAEFAMRHPAKRFCCRAHKNNAKNKRLYSPEQRRIRLQREMSCPLLRWVDNQRKQAYLKTEAGRASTARYRERLRMRPPDDQAVRRRRESRRKAWYKREAIKRGCSGTHTDEQVEQQAARQRHRCYWCGERIGSVIHRDYHPDHVVPLSLGGSNDAANIVAACPHCNMSKAGTHPIEWAGVLC